MGALVDQQALQARPGDAVGRRRRDPPGRGVCAVPVVDVGRCRTIQAVSTPVFVVVLVLGILGVQVLIWIPIVLWFRRRSRAVAAQLATELESESVVRAPEKAVYRGATASGYPMVRNNGLIALTGSRLLFRTLTGKAFEIPVASIRGVRLAKVFNRSAVGGREHLVVQTASGQIAFYVSDNPAWVAALTPAAHR